MTMHIHPPEKPTATRPSSDGEVKNLGCMVGASMVTMLTTVAYSRRRANRCRQAKKARAIIIQILHGDAREC